MTAGSLRILVLEDERSHADLLREALERSGYSVVVRNTFETGMATLASEPFDVVITDVDLAGHRGGEVLAVAQRLSSAPEVMLVAGIGSIEDAVASMQLGASHYFTKPLDVDEIRAALGKAEERRRVRTKGEVLELRPYVPRGFEGLLGTSASMQRVFDTIRRIAPTQATVLIQGENGTGKELVARALHSLSPRRLGPFVALNCAALSEGVLESELFGHEKGAFTGAAKTREGVFEFAHQGTLFLDEIGDMPLSVQVKLLRVIQEREITRVGSSRSIKIDVRLVAATNRDLKKAIQEGAFREDLYWRLKVVSVDMPPLRQRREDLRLLADHFLSESARRHGRTIEGLSPEVHEIFQGYAWPGNVRQFQNTIEHMVVMSEGTILTKNDLPDDFVREERPSSHALVSVSDIGNWTLERLERELIKLQLDRAEGNRAKAAKALGISERTLYRKIREYGIP